ncbi:hypothetical protein OG245_06120 [Streptomyces sp. NBC_01116]|uniref:hypothetical protein n=1 Tax=Streptomyces sp. NBC_01116 TaxID=2903752 RepID=UPI00324CC984
MSTLQAASAVISPPGTPYDESPATLSYYRDLVEPFGMTVDEELLRSAPHVTHRELIDRLGAPEDIRRCDPDLVIVTHALPDVTPFAAIAPHLNWLLGDRATTSFGISQQGLAAPFTALRIISAFQRSGRSRTAVLAVLEQTTLPTRFALAHDTPLTDSGALLVLGVDGGPQVTDVSAIDTTRAAVERLTELVAADPQGTLLVLGPWFDESGLDPAARRQRLAAGTYATSVWLALARHWRTWRQEYAAVVLCDTDPRTGSTHLAVLRSDRETPGRTGAAGTGAGT